MKAFAALYTALDETTKTNEKVEALAAYFASATPEDAAWALYFLIGRRPRQAVPSARLRAWATEAAGIPDWLFGECYDAAGDLAETLALLLPENDQRQTTNDERRTTASDFL
jgi:DNA ligase-1